MFRRIMVILSGMVMLAILGGVVYVASRQNLKFNPPSPNITASSDPTVIARGRYIVRTVVNCAQCHGDTTQHEVSDDTPLSGGFTWHIPPGTFYARNITPDPETGIGNFSDGIVARTLRYGVGSDGRALLPFMELQGLSDEDLAAVISYLRAQPPVHNMVPAHKYNLLGAIVKATALANPVGPKETPPAVSPRGATVENGHYMVESVALCWACHTQRSQETGAITGPRFGGATGFDEGPNGSWSPPNITSDAETGRLGQISEDQFVARIRAGRIIPNSPMPWEGLSRMDEDDIRAIYRYLKTVPPAKRDVGPPYVEKKKT